MSLHHTLYRKLAVLIPTLPQVPEYVTSQVRGFMDLNLDLLSRDGEIMTLGASTPKVDEMQARTGNQRGESLHEFQR